MKVLFICKKNECYGFTAYTRRSSGLFNSTRFIVKGLMNHGTRAAIIEVVDNNSIDKEVTWLKPDVVVIEALWVVPEKFDILKKLHPNVKWLVHLHSGMPFLALEGIAMSWLLEYAKRGIGMIANSPESYEALRCLLPTSSLVYLPNVYISAPRVARKNDSSDTINIGCFGAVRPLKNHLIQAIAAIQFAKENNIHKLRFFINSSRIETGGDPVMRNLVDLFNNTPGVALIRTPWCEPEEFLDILQNHIDIGMQVSLTETFNVVSADYVTAGIPIVVSKEVSWVSCWNKALDNSVSSIVRTMNYVRYNPMLISWNQRLLLNHSKRAQRDWVDFIDNL